MNGRLLLCLAIWAVVFVAGGSSCPLRKKDDLPPGAFATPPTLEEAIAVINRNTDHIRQLQARGVRLTVQGVPRLKGNLALERPRRFRLEAGLTTLTGSDVDIGSNDNVLWFWARLNKPPGVYFATHDRYHLSPARQMLPIEPHWLIEALGLVHFDPQGQHHGPYSRAPGRFEIHSRVATPEGLATKITVVDDRTGWVLEQQMYDPQGRMVAVAKASDHRHYPRERTTLPRKVEVELPSAQMSFTIETPDYWINRLEGDPEQLWSMPQIGGSPPVDITDPRFLSAMGYEDEQRSYR